MRDDALRGKLNMMLDVHRELLLDETRTNAFREAICRVVKPGSVVLDIGTGSGILAFFACQAGARRVFAVEEKHTADLATLLAKHLGFADRIEVIHDRSTKIELPELADVLVTETLGAFGFEERILSSVLDARSRLLRPGAVIIPQRLDLHAVPVELPRVFDRHIAWWRQAPYGLDLSPAAMFASNTMYVSNVEASAFLATPARITSTELSASENTEVVGDAHFETTRAGTVFGFSGWFRAVLVPGVELSTEHPGTNWNHVFLPLEEPIPMERGTNIDLELHCSDGAAWRWKGRVGSVPFDQTTWLASPPCFASS